MTSLFVIRITYWLGIVADALWAVALFVPQVYGFLIGNPGFDPDLQTRLIMGIGGSMMTGWTFLLLWAVRKPVERRVVMLLTACPVLVGLLVVALIGVLSGNRSNVWIIIKSVALLILMTTSYIMAGRIDLESDRRKEVT